MSTPPAPRLPPWVAALAFGAAAAVRVAYALTFPPAAVIESVDAQGYQQIAVNLLAGHGFTLQAALPYRPDAVRTPLYPAFVAVVYALAGPQPQAVAIAQAVVDGVSAVMTGMIAARLAGPRAGAAAAFAYALMPGQVRAANALLTETLLTFLITLATITLLNFAEARRLRCAAATGAVLGLAVLCKPNVVLLPFLYAAGASWLASTAGDRNAGASRNAALTAGGTTLLAALVVVAPWIARNWLIFGQPMLSTAFQDNLARVTAPATLAELQGEVVAPWTPRWEAYYTQITTEAAQRFAWPADDLERLGARDYEARQAQIAAVAFEIVREHPEAAVASHLKGFARSWIPTEYRFWYEYLSDQPWTTVAQDDVVGRALALARQGSWGPALDLLVVARWTGLPPLARVLWYGWGLAYIGAAILAAIGGARLLRRSPAVAATLAMTVLYVTFLPGPIAQVRFRVPVVPLIVAVEAAGLPGTQVSNEAKP